MKNLLKFASIAMVMALALYSQIGPDMTTVQAADDTVEKDKIEFMTQGDQSDAAFETKKVSYYGAGTANAPIAFYINDADLNYKHSATTTYTGANGGTAVAADKVWKLFDAASTAAVVGVANIVGASVPASGSQEFTSAAGDVRNGSIAVVRGGVDSLVTDTYNLADGSFSLAAASSVGDGNPNSGADQLVVATFDFDAQDCYGGIGGVIGSSNEATVNKAIAAANPNGDVAGCGSATNNAQRVKVTSTSDSSGEWATIVEVKAYGDDDPTSANDKALTGGIFRGSVNISTDASHSAAADGSVWVQDGDTLTVTYYEASSATGEVGAAIDTDTAIIDATAPSIVNVTPIDGTLTNDVSPTITFTITDDGSGFDKTVTSFGDHVAVSINGCDVADTELGVSAHSENSITLTYSPAIDWTSGAKLADGNAANCAGNATQRVSAGFNVDSTYTGVVNNTQRDGTASEIDGIQFSWQIVATDEANNSKTLGVKEDGAKGAGGAANAYAASFADSDLNLRIDTQVPACAATCVTGAKAWDAGAKADKTDKSSVKLSFDESMDPNSITASDFTVSGTGVTSSTIVSVTMGGKEFDTNKFVYLDLAEDLGPNAKPKVKLVGEITDRAGNKLKPDTGKTSKTLGTASDAVDPTLSNGAVTLQLLASKDETTVSFESNENLTNTGVLPNKDAAGNAAGADHANQTHVGCTCGSMSGGSATQQVADGANEGADDAAAIDGTDTTKVTMTLSSPKMGSGKIKQTTIGTDGIYGIALTGRDAADNNGVAGITKVTNEDVSKYFTVAGKLTDTQADANIDTAGDYVRIKLKKWPLADHDGDGEMSDSIVGLTVGGTALTATQMSGLRIDEIDWSTGETVLLELDVANGVDIDAGDTVKVTYYYVDAANTIEIDTSGPSATFTPKDGDSTTDTTPSVAIAWNDDEYAGDTHTTVTMTKAELKDGDGEITDILGVLTSTDNKTFYYKPIEALATGEYTITVKADDEAGNESTEYSAKITIKDRTKTEIAMVPGWNLISIPGSPADGDINTILTNSQIDTVLTYDPSTPGGWLTAVRDGDSLVGTLTTIDASHGYWIHSNNSDAIKVDIPGYVGGATSVPPVVNVVEGWNLIPAATLTGATTWDPDIYLAGLDWVKLKMWDASGEAWEDILPTTGRVSDAGAFTDTANDAKMIAGKGYWLYANSAGVIIP